MKSAVAVHTKGLRICIVGADEAVDFFDEVGGGVERAATDSALSDEGEEALDLIEPGGIGGGEVNVPTRPACEPRSDFGMLVSGVVVDDKMDVELGRYIGLDMPQEGEELLMTMAGFALGDDRAVEHVEGSEQRGCAVALVVVGDAFDVAEPHGKHGLGTFEGLDLAFLIDAKHHCLVRRIEIKPDHVAQLLDEEGIGRKLEACGCGEVADRRAGTGDGRCSWRSQSLWRLRARSNVLQLWVCERVFW